MGAQIKDTLSDRIVKNRFEAVESNVLGAEGGVWSAIRGVIFLAAPSRMSTVFLKACLAKQPALFNWLSRHIARGRDPPP